MAEPLAGLSVKEMNCTRGYRELFSGLNFSIESGDVLRVEGENRSGRNSVAEIPSSKIGSDYQLSLH